MVAGSNTDAMLLLLELHKAVGNMVLGLQDCHTPPMITLDACPSFTCVITVPALKLTRCYEVVHIAEALFEHEESIRCVTHMPYQECNLDHYEQI